MTSSTALIRLNSPISLYGIASALSASPSHLIGVHLSAESSSFSWGSQKSSARQSTSDRCSNTSSLSASLRHKFEFTRRELSRNASVREAHRSILRSSSPSSFRRISALTNTSRAMASLTSSPDPNSPVVTPQWLADNLEHVKVLDASWYLPTEKRNPGAEYQSVRVKGAQFFDLEAIADPDTDLPHMLPSPESFSAAASALGLTNDSPIVVYDGKGIFSAARAWWMFRTFGHESVWVLSGGLPLYRSLHLPVGEGGEGPSDVAGKAAKAVMTGGGSGGGGSFKAKLKPEMVQSLQQVMANIDSKESQVIDARSKGRFDGTAPEPRAGMRGGHIPGSMSVPMTEVLTADGQLKETEDLEKKFKSAGLDLDGRVVASCGTGVTACVLVLALHKLGKKNVPVYDGSWSEWAVSPNTPAETMVAK